MFRGCSGTTSLGGKWLFFISFPSLRVPLSVDWRLGGSFRRVCRASLSLCSGRMAFDAIRTTFEASSPPIDKGRGKVPWVGVKVPPLLGNKSTSTSPS